MSLLKQNKGKGPDDKSQRVKENEALNTGKCRSASCSDNLLTKYALFNLLYPYDSGLSRFETRLIVVPTRGFGGIASTKSKQVSSCGHSECGSKREICGER